MKRLVSEAAKMIEGIRDKILHLQLGIFQDYLEIRMVEAFGDDWINNVIEICERKASGQHGYTYAKVAEIKRTKGSISKKNF